MNRGLLSLASREALPVTLGYGLVLLLFEVLVAYVFPQFFGEASAAFLQLGFIKNMIAALLGTEVGDMLSPQMFTAMPWVHPIVLTVVWAHVITLASRVPAGEVERGTADLVLGLPISRWQWYCASTLVWALSGMVVLILGVLGNLLGTVLAAGAALPSAGALSKVQINLFALFLAVGGAASLTSCLSERRGRAVGAVFTFVLLSFLWNFLGQFWQPAKTLSFLSILSFYQPLRVFQSNALPWSDVLVLLTVALTSWAAGGLFLARRDLRT